MRWIAAVLLVSVALPVVAQSKKARAVVTNAQAALDSGSAEPERDIKPAIDMLAASKDHDDQNYLVDKIIDMGRGDGSSPAAVKRYILDNMTPVLLAIAANQANDHFLRGDAILGLRNLGASRDVLQQVTDIALKDSNAFVKSRGEILENYIQSMPAESKVANVKPVDAGKEADALEFLKSHRLGASVDQLKRSAMEGSPEEVDALIAAGVDVNAAPGGDDALQYAILGCSQGVDAAATVKIIDALIKAGADVKRKKDNDNTPLLSAAQYCGPQVVTRFISAGADVNAKNGSGTTPLSIALILNRLDTAEALVNQGARLSADEVSTMTITDPRAKAIVQKATRKKTSKKQG